MKENEHKEFTVGRKGSLSLSTRRDNLERGLLPLKTGKTHRQQSTEYVVIHTDRGREKWEKEWGYSQCIESRNKKEERETTIIMPQMKNTFRTSFSHEEGKRMKKKKTIKH